MTEVGGTSGPTCSPAMPPGAGSPVLCPEALKIPKEEVHKLRSLLQCWATCMLKMVSRPQLPHRAGTSPSALHASPQTPKDTGHHVLQSSLPREKPCCRPQGLNSCAMLLQKVTCHCHSSALPLAAIAGGRGVLTTWSPSPWDVRAGDRRAPPSAPGHDLAGAEDQVRSCVQVQAARLLQCACSCSEGNVAHLPGEAQALAWFCTACQALISIV